MYSLLCIHNCFIAESKLRKLHQPSQRPGSTLSIPCPWSSRRTTRSLLQGKPGPHTLAPSRVQLHPPPQIPDFQILQINFLEHWSTSVHLSVPVPISRTCRKEGSVPSVTVVVVVVVNRTGSVDSSAFQEQMERDWLLETPVIVASGVVKVGDCSKDLWRCQRLVRAAVALLDWFTVLPRSRARLLPPVVQPEIVSIRCRFHSVIRCMHFFLESVRINSTFKYVIYSGDVILTMYQFYL